MGCGVPTVGYGDPKMGVRWWSPAAGPPKTPRPPLTDVGGRLGHHELLVADAGVGDAGLRRRGWDHKEPLQWGHGSAGVTSADMGHPVLMWGTQCLYGAPRAPSDLMGHSVLLWGTQCCYGAPSALMGNPALIWGIQCCYGVPGADMGHPVCYGAPSALIGNPVLLWGTQCCYGASGAAMGHPVLMWGTRC